MVKCLKYMFLVLLFKKGRQNKDIYTQTKTKKMNLLTFVKEIRISFKCEFFTKKGNFS